MAKSVCPAPVQVSVLKKMVGFLFLSVFPGQVGTQEIHNILCGLSIQQSTPTLFLTYIIFWSSLWIQRQFFSEELLLHCTWCHNEVFRVPHLCSLCKLQPASIWWDWNCWLRTVEWTTCGPPRQGMCILIILSPSITSNQEEHNSFLLHEAHNGYWHSQTVKGFCQEYSVCVHQAKRILSGLVPPCIPLLAILNQSLYVWNESSLAKPTISVSW